MTILEKMTKNLISGPISARVAQIGPSMSFTSTRC